MSRRSKMSKIKEILRLSEIEGLSNNAIGKSVGCSHNTVRELVRRAQDVGLTWPVADNLGDDEIERRIYGDKRPTTEPRPEPDLEYIERELKRPGVNLSLLWHEYKQEHPDGVQYTQFCERYRKWVGARKVSLHIRHKAGEKMFVDWVGDTMTVINPETGEAITAYLFVSAIGTSGYPYVEAFPTKEKGNWIRAHVNAFRHYGGLPLILVPDNDKSAVTSPSRYDPELNKTYREMAEYYGVAVIPARVRRPKDKPKVEKCVKDTETWIMAALRNRQFFSFSELNAAIRVKLSEFSEKPFQKLEGSRKSEFEQYDSPALRPLPPKPYEYADWYSSTVNTDYHIEVLKQYYSVPYDCAGQKVDVRVGHDVVEIFHKGLRVCSHQRLKGRLRQYSTDVGHMPENHRAYVGMNRDGAIRWAEEQGENIRLLVEKIFGRVTVEQQAYRSIMGLMRIVKTYGSEITDDACALAVSAREYGCGYVERLIKTGVVKKQKAEVIIRHDNIRGPGYYGGEANVHA